MNVIRAPDDSKPQGQNCGACANSINCWVEGLDKKYIISNLLVCRIKRGIKVEQSTKLLLKMLRPKFKKLAKEAIKNSSIDLATAIADHESLAIESITHRYVMGEIAYPFHYLFGFPNGILRRYAHSYARKTREFQDRHVLERATETRLETDVAEDPYEEQETEATRAARDVIEDGVTLNTLEYRVMTFCMQNCPDQKKLLNGMHTALARITGINRLKITKAYADACKAIVSEVRKTHKKLDN